MVVIDGQIIRTDGAEGPSPENQSWRRFASQFIDASNPLIGQMVAPRERVTLAIANSDGSGLTPVFSGCVPLISDEEATALDDETSTVEQLFGWDWRSKQEEDAEDFARRARLAMVAGTSRSKVGDAGQPSYFPEGSLVSSLRNTPGIDLNNGLLRLVILSDLALYETPLSDVTTSRETGLRDAEATRLSMGRVEVHFFSNDGTGSLAVNEYMRAFFLASGARLESLASGSSALSSNNIPERVDVYQGVANFPRIGDVPVRMRLAVDRNKSVTMSWFGEQRERAREIPFKGVLTCTTPESCTYQGDDVFAQVWGDPAGETPDCVGDMPMGGMRSLEFVIDGESIIGRVYDTVCVIAGYEDVGIEFAMQRIERGQW